jgi:putative transposase
MARQLRIIIPDVPSHITQRGNNGRDVFYSDHDRKRYLERIIQYSSAYKLEIIGYCIMSNHVHFVVIPREKNSISKTLQIVHMMHTQSINKAKGWKGHLWHSRFFSCPLDDKHLWLALRYVEQNPVRAGIVKLAIDYPWSSARGHCGLSDDPVTSLVPEFSDMFDGWLDSLCEVPDVESIDRLRYCTMRGLPCGDKRFVKSISARVSGK